MSRTVGKAGLELIKELEGCELTAYKCPAEVWTIGYGHTSGVTADMKITMEQAEKFLISDCQKFADYVDNVKYVPITASLNSNQRDALISFAFNLGQGNLKTLCANRTIEQIAKKIPAYNKAGGKVLAGLTRRRAAEQALFNKAVTVTNNPYKKSTKNIKKGSTGEVVKWVQYELKQKGYNCGNIDGIFGRNTETAVIAFQAKNRLSVDGIVGAKTRAALEAQI